MDKPVCSESESVLQYVKRREGKTWTPADTLAVKVIMKEFLTQLGVIKAMAQEALDLNG